MGRGTIFSTIGVALEALKGERAVSDLAVAFAAGPTLTHLWKQAVLAGTAGIFEPGGKSVAAGIDEIGFVICMPGSGNWPSPTIFIAKAPAMGRKMRRV